MLKKLCRAYLELDCFYFLLAMKLSLVVIEYTDQIKFFRKQTILFAVQFSQKCQQNLEKIIKESFSLQINTIPVYTLLSKTILKNWLVVQKLKIVLSRVFITFEAFHLTLFTCSPF